MDLGKHYSQYKCQILSYADHHPHMDMFRLLPQPALPKCEALNCSGLCERQMFTQTASMETALIGEICMCSETFCAPVPATTFIPSHSDLLVQMNKVGFTFNFVNKHLFCSFIFLRKFSVGSLRCLRAQRLNSQLEFLQLQAAEKPAHSELNLQDI